MFFFCKLIKNPSWKFPSPPGTGCYGRSVKSMASEKRSRRRRDCQRDNPRFSTRMPVGFFGCREVVAAGTVASYANLVGDNAREFYAPK